MSKAAGVTIPDGHRWGLHNLRHSLSNWLVNNAKESPKTVQGILGHSRIQTTLDLYTDEDLRRDDCGTGKVSLCRGIRIGERSVDAVGGIVGRSFRCHVR